jgi:hypothetical protein
MELMWKVSEEAWSVGWMEEMEFQLWKIMGEGPGKYGQLFLDERFLEQLRDQAKKAEGWIYWDKTEQETWIDASGWEAMYAAWRARPGPLGQPE